MNIILKNFVKLTFIVIILLSIDFKSVESSPVGNPIPSQYLNQNYDLKLKPNGETQVYLKSNFTSNIRDFNLDTLKFYLPE